MKLRSERYIALLIWASLLPLGCSSNVSANEVSQHEITSTVVTAAFTHTVRPTATRTPEPTATPLPTSTATSVPTLTPTPALPEEIYIRDIRGHKQNFPLGCEAAAAKDWANYFGVDFSEFDFQHGLPLSDNPDVGFVGSVNSPWGQVPPYGYGVHAAPVAELLNHYGLQARAVTGYTVEDIKQNLAQQKPVIVWVIGNVVGGVPYEYTDSKGNKSIVAAYEHVVIVTGYNTKKFRYMNNGKFYEVPYDIFENSWGVLGNMAIILEGEALQQ